MSATEFLLSAALAAVLVASGVLLGGRAGFLAGYAKGRTEVILGLSERIKELMEPEPEAGGHEQ